MGTRFELFERIFLLTETERQGNLWMKEQWQLSGLEMSVSGEKSSLKDCNYNTVCKVLPWEYRVLGLESSQEDMTPFTQLGDHTHTHTPITDMVKLSCQLYELGECRTLQVRSKFFILLSDFMLCHACAPIITHRASSSASAKNPLSPCWMYSLDYKFTRSWRETAS